MKIQAATYLPDRMIITIKKDLEALSDSNGEIQPFKSLEEVGYFFHEWIHFLHNTSTLIGLTIFYNYIGLWKIFRFTYNDYGEAGVVEICEDYKIQLNELLTFIGNNRKANQDNYKLISSHIKDIKIKSYVMKIDQAGIFPIANINCNIEVTNAESFYTLLGTHEILENLAFLLEKKLTLELFTLDALMSDESAIIPYRIIELFIEHKLPNLSLDDKIACMIASLQAPSPPIALEAILNLLVESKNNGGCKNLKEIDIVEYWSKENVKGNKDFIENVKKNIEESFPKNEAIGNSLKNILPTFLDNINFRADNNLLEFEIINNCRNDIKNFDLVIKKYKGCTIIKQNAGDEDKLNRDIMYLLKYSAYSEDWYTFYSAIKFIMAHYNGKGFNKTSNIEPNRKHKCPFYTVCTLELRKAKPEICAQSPWKSEKIQSSENQGLCWYAAGVRQTKFVDEKAPTM